MVNAQMGKLGQAIMRANPSGSHKAYVTRAEAVIRLQDDLSESVGIEPVVVYAADLKCLLDMVKEIVQEELRAACRLREALIPSAETKAAYIGEFHITEILTDPSGEDYAVKITVPWTTIKEIMAAIAKRAGIETRADVAELLATELHK